MTSWRRALISVVAMLAVPQSLWSADAAIDRREANQPILLGEFNSPQCDINALQFMADGANRWRLFAAGRDKIVWQWALRSEDGGQSVRLDPLERIRWPIDRGYRGLVYTLATQSGEAGSSLVAFGGVGEIHFPAGVFVSAAETSERQQILNVPDGIPLQWHVTSLAFWPRQARHLAVGYFAMDPGNARIAVWDLDHPRQSRAILATNFDSIDHLAISPDGRRLVAAAGNRPAIKLWSIEQLSPWKEGHSRELELPSPITGLCWIDQDEFAVATKKHGVRRFRDARPTVELSETVEVIVRNHTRRRVTFSVAKGTKPVSSWSVEPNSKRVETTADGNQLSLREASSEVLAIPFTFGRGEHHEFDIRPASSGSGVVLSVVMATRNLVCANGRLATIRDEFTLSKGQRESEKYRVRVACESTSSELELSVGLKDSAFEDIRCRLALSPDGKFLAASGWKWRSANQPFGQQAVQEIRLWRLADGELVSVLPDRRLSLNGLSQIQRVEISRSQPTRSFPDRVRFEWLARQSVIAGETDAQPEARSGFSLTADAALNDGTIGLDSAATWGPHANEVPQNWEIRSEEDRFWLTPTTPSRKEIGPIPHLKWFSQEVWRGQEFTRQNRRYVAVAYPAGILVWNVDRLRSGPGNAVPAWSQSLVRCFFGHVGRVNCLSASADGDWLISGAADGSISLWSLQGIDQPYDGQKELGLELRQESGRTFVKSVVEGLPAFVAGLKGDNPSRSGDEIMGLTVSKPGRPPVETQVPRERWDEALRQLSPEQDVRFEIRGKAGFLGSSVYREPLWTLYPMLDGQWVMVTPSQVFGASSDEAMRRFGWHMNLTTEGHVELFPLDLFREKYDDVVSIVTSWKSQVPAVRPGSLELPSLVEITDVRAGGEAISTTAELPQPVDLSVNLRVQQTADEELRQLELWCNGTLIQKSKLSAAGEPTQSPLPWIVRKDVLRVGDRNTLVGVVRSRLRDQKRSNSPANNAAENKDVKNAVDDDPQGYISLTNRALRSVRVGGTVTPKTPKLHFVGIGVTELQHESGFRNSPTPIEPLKFSANDVCLLGEALADRRQASGFDLGEFHYLVSAPPEGLDLKAGRIAKPTRDQVLKTLDRLCEIAGPNDFVWIAIACHGFNHRSQASLVVQDTTPNWENVLTDKDLFEDRLYQLKAPALVLLDACHSGSALTSNALRGLSGFGLGPEVLVSCKPNQLSYENEKLRYDHGHWYGMGAFTASLVEALRGDALSVGPSGTRTMIPDRASNLMDRNGDGYLSVEELGLHAAVRVPAIRRLSSGKDEALELQQPDLLPSLAFPRNRIRFRIPQP